jgi:hypothetical protein
MCYFRPFKKLNVQDKESYSIILACLLAKPFTALYEY